MGQNEGKACLKILVGWLLAGLAAALLLAAAVTYQEYQNFAEFTGAVLMTGRQADGRGNQDSVGLTGQEADSRGNQDSVGLTGRKPDSQKNHDYEMDGSRPGDGETDIQQAVASALKYGSHSDRNAGKALFQEYGFHIWSRLGENFFFIAGGCVILFEVIGMFCFLIWKREQRRRRERIDGLTGYLMRANRGEACALQRKEDAFSYLEDEIYKTVMELRSSKEEAVHDHTVLSERIVDIAHQLKTPITSMSLMAELLEGQQTKEREECLKRLALQIHRLQNLINALLSLAKLEAHAIRLEKEEVDVETLLDGAAEPLQELLQEKKIRLDVSGRPARLLADGRWTEEAIQNILKNCAEHSPCGGVIEVRWEENPLYVEIRITDSGRGISRKDLPHLFERFYRGEDAQKDSAGVGLSLAKLVVEQQGGHIYAENTAEGHARFRMRFYR